MQARSVSESPSMSHFARRVVLQVSEPVSGKEVKLRLVLHSEATVARQLSISVSVVAMGYNGRKVGDIQQELKEKTLLAGKGDFPSVEMLLLNFRGLNSESDIRVDKSNHSGRL